MRSNAAGIRLGARHLLSNFRIDIVNRGFLLQGPRQHHRADDCDQQKNARDLKRQRRIV